MKKLATVAAFAVAAFLSASPAWSQAKVVDSCSGLGAAIFARNSGGAPLVIDKTGVLCVNASVAASIGGFAPGGNFANLTSTAASADVALPTGAVVAAFNTGTSAASCTLSIGAGTAVANRNVIQAGSWFAFTVGSNTHISCINQAGDAASNVVVLSGGSGLPTGAGGGGGSGGGGGAITIASGAVASGAYAAGSIASGAMVDLGAIADVAATAGSTGSVSAKLRLMTTQLGTINTTLGSPFQAGGAISNITGTVSLPTGASTSALQSTGNTSLGTIATNTTGASTSALQSTGNTSLSTIATNTTGVATAANQSTGNTSLGTIATNTTNAATTTLQTTGNTSLSTIATNTTGVATAANQAATQGTVAAGAAASKSDLVGGQFNSTPPSLSTGQQAALQVDSSGNLKVTAATLEPCQAIAKIYVPISQATSAQLFTGTASKKTYVCSIMIVGADAENVSLVGGTGTVCATSPTAVLGGATAANGMNLAANGGFTLGNGMATVAQGSVNADNICLLQSGTGRVSGGITYVQN